MKSKLRYFFVFLILCINACSKDVQSQLSVLKESKEITPARYFEVKSEKRKIYIAAEVHGLAKRNYEFINYSIGEKIYHNAKLVYVEPLADAGIKLERPENEVLEFKKLISPSTWIDIENQIERIRKRGHQFIKFQEKLDEYLKKIEVSEPDTSYMYLKSIYSAEMFLFESQNLPALQPGLRMHLTVLENKKYPKFQLIEPYSSGGNIWPKYCNSKENAEFLAQEALLAFKSGVKYAVATAAQSMLYVDGATDIEKAQEIFEASNAGKVLVRCNIEPRNAAWFSTMKTILNSPGEPVFFILGAAHVAGKNGLLAKLRAAGYTEIRPIKSIDLL
ncbi:MAG: TraB/GumN family protein [Brachymonas sp.]|nr:TraB/GumN family protein [Brachymonas sp.]